jgi:hypothetical protein
MTENVENGFENPAALRAEVAAPHFEDRIVVSTAQPVVPLKEIQKQLNLRRLWFLCGAFAIAIVLGAASALLAVQLKRIAAGNQQATQIEEPQPEAITAEAQTLPVPDPLAEAAVSEETASEEVAPAEPSVTVPERQAPVAQRPRARGRDRERLRDEGVQPSEEEELEQIREAVLYERWQERRARRVERRERRNRGDRDLSQLDEIFEGRRRRAERP